MLSFWASMKFSYSLFLVLVFFLFSSLYKIAVIKIQMFSISVEKLFCWKLVETSNHSQYWIQRLFCWLPAFLLP